MSAHKASWFVISLVLRHLNRYNPEGVDYHFNLSESNRVALLNEMQNTAVGIVHYTLLEDLYRMKYDDSA